MRHQAPAVRILPMSDRADGFRGWSIEQVRKGLFLRDLPARKGRYRYRSAGLNAVAGTVVLFQFQARIIASAVFLRDEKFERPINGCAGALHFEVESIRTFEPLDIDAMRKVWPGIRAFGHVKQVLNAAGYPMFRQRLKRVEVPSCRNGSSSKAFKAAE